jgi:hypothetical protein
MATSEQDFTEDTFDSVEKPNKSSAFVKSDNQELKRIRWRKWYGCQRVVSPDIERPKDIDPPFELNN